MNRNNELEVVPYPHIHGLRIFFNTIGYRTMHMHAELELLWVLDGSLRIVSENRDIVAPPDALLFLHSHQPHKFYAHDETCTYLCIQIHPDFFNHVGSKCEQIDFETLEIGTRLSRAGAQAFRTCLARAVQAYLRQEAGDALRCAGQLYLAMATLLEEVPYKILSDSEIRLRKKTSGRLERLMQYVEQNYTERITLSAFAEQEGLSMGYLSHFVKEHTQKTFQAYVESVRFRHACQLMHSTQATMMEISIASGFSDYRYFSRAFIKRTGMSPEKYRLMEQSEPLQVASQSEQSSEYLYPHDKARELFAHFLSVWANC